jgi:hypothetical protein
VDFPLVQAAAPADTMHVLCAAAAASTAAKTPPFSLTWIQPHIASAILSAPVASGLHA